MENFKEGNNCHNEKLLNLQFSRHLFSSKKHWEIILTGKKNPKVVDVSIIVKLFSSSMFVYNFPTNLQQVIEKRIARSFHLLQVQLTSPFHLTEILFLRMQPSKLPFIWPQLTKQLGRHETADWITVKTWVLFWIGARIVLYFYFFGRINTKSSSRNDSVPVLYPLFCTLNFFICFYLLDENQCPGPDSLLYCCFFMCTSLQLGVLKKISENYYLGDWMHSCTAGVRQPATS